MSVSIVVQDGAYTVMMERLEAKGVIRSEDNSGPDGFARGKAKEDIPELCKAFAFEKFKTLISQIRVSMDFPHSGYLYGRSKVVLS